MYETLIAKIKATLEELKVAGLIASYSTVPGAEITTWPHVFFKPDGFTNEFNTNKENEIVYSFLMLVMVTAVAGTNGGAEKAFTEVLPKVVDGITAKFNTDWDQGVVGGHRVRILIDSASSWELSEEEAGLVAYAPLSVQVKTLVGT